MTHILFEIFKVRLMMGYGFEMIETKFYSRGDFVFRIFRKEKCFSCRYNPF